MDEFREWLEKQLERADGAKRGSAWVPGPDPNDVRSELLTDLLEEYDRHHQPRRDTPMTVEEVRAWVDGVDWLPEGHRLSILSDCITLESDGLTIAQLDERSIWCWGHYGLSGAHLPILHRICRETGWGGR